MAKKKGINNRLVGGIIGAIVVLVVVVPVLDLVLGVGLKIIVRSLSVANALIGSFVAVSITIMFSLSSSNPIVYNTVLSSIPNASPPKLKSMFDNTISKVFDSELNKSI